MTEAFETIEDGLKEALKVIEGEPVLLHSSLGNLCVARWIDGKWMAAGQREEEVYFHPVRVTRISAEE